MVKLGDTEDETEEVEVEGDATAAEDDCASEGGADSEAESDEEDEELRPGSIVWVRFRSWYPAEVLSVDQLGVKEQATPLPPDTVYVIRFGISDIRLAKTKFLNQLGEDAVDAAMARRGPQI